MKWLRVTAAVIGPSGPLVERIEVFGDHLHGGHEGEVELAVLPGTEHCYVARAKVGHCWISGSLRELTGQTALPIWEFKTKTVE